MLGSTVAYIQDNSSTFYNSFGFHIVSWIQSTVRSNIVGEFHRNAPIAGIWTGFNPLKFKPIWIYAYLYQISTHISPES